MKDDPTSAPSAESDAARARLLELSRSRGSSLAGLSALIGRNSSYLQQFIRKGSPRKLEEQDRRILAALQADSRVSNQELADRAGMSASACWRRAAARDCPAP